MRWGGEPVAREDVVSWCPRVSLSPTTGVPGKRSQGQFARVEGVVRRRKPAKVQGVHDLLACCETRRGMGTIPSRTLGGQTSLQWRQRSPSGSRRRVMKAKRVGKPVSRAHSGLFSQPMQPSLLKAPAMAPSPLRLPEARS
jgi:hypothetical protein